MKGLHAVSLNSYEFNENRFNLRNALLYPYPANVDNMASFYQC
jgi:hypothetical protein